MKAFSKLILYTLVLVGSMLFAPEISLAQAASAPAYKGPINASVSFPVSVKGRNFKVSGDRLNSDSSGSVSQAYVDSLFASLSYTIGGVDTTKAIVAYLDSSLVVAKVDTPRNTYGQISLTNESPTDFLGAGDEIKIAYQTPYPFQAVPVISLVSDDGVDVLAVLKDPQTDSFIIKLIDGVPPDTTVYITYHVKAE
jgi:hypothetical protein